MKANESKLIHVTFTTRRETCATHPSRRCQVSEIRCSQYSAHLSAHPNDLIVNLTELQIKGK
jgi:hypothetical protein